VGQVTQPYEKGGLAIRLSRIMNLALGVKVTWRFITRESSWWKKILEVKYMKHNRKLLLDKGSSIRPYSQVWSLIKNTLSLIKENSSKIPRNGKLTKIWKDRIMRN